MTEYVNNYPVAAQMRDATSDTAQSIVVCDRVGNPSPDRYAVWTVAQISGRTEAWQGFYTDDYYVALTHAARRAAGI